jgi:hypothetical protein
MLTFRQVISDIIDDLKAVNLDDRISYRFIGSKFNNEIAYFLRLEAKSREFAKLQNLWKPVNCLKLKEVNLGECNAIESCNTLLRSEDKIPKVFDTNYGLLIKVLTVDGRRTIPLIANSSEAEDYNNRRWGKAKDICYLENNYLYFPDSSLEAVKLLLIPMDPYEVDKANGAIGCTFPLDAELPYPKYLVTLAKREVLNQLSGITKRVVEDEKGDENTNIKS